jgi:3-oxoacid CoA-transferase
MCITNLAVFKYLQGKLTLIELMPGVSLEEVKKNTAADFAIALK